MDNKVEMLMNNEIVSQDAMMEGKTFKVGRGSVRWLAVFLPLTSCHSN